MPLKCYTSVCENHIWKMLNSGFYFHFIYKWKEKDSYSLQSVLSVRTDHLETMASTFPNKGVISNLGLIWFRVSQKFNSFAGSQGPFEVWYKTKGQEKGVKANFCDWLLLGGKIFKCFWKLFQIYPNNKCFSGDM